MAAESEIQAFLNKAYHTVMEDGSVAAVGRDWVKDVRDTFNQVFFGHGDRGVEPGSPLNPLFSDLAEDRQAHAAALEPAAATPSPADLGGQGLPRKQAETPLVSPADLTETASPAAQQHDQQQRQGRGLSM